MSRKIQKRKNKILKLKIVFEEREIAEEEEQVGNLEFKEILNQFNDRIRPDQKQHFEELFFGKKEDISAKSKNKATSDSTEIEPAKESVPNPPKAENLNSPKWVKDLYKKIVQRSHPDKYVGFSITAIKEKFTTIYMNAVKAFEDQDIGLLLMCAHDVEIDISTIPESESFIDQSINKQQSRINELTKLIGYQWYHLIESNRMPFLEMYLNNLGYVFDRKKAESAIRKNRVKRKPGQRPEKLLRVKRK